MAKRKAKRSSKTHFMTKHNYESIQLFPCEINKLAYLYMMEELCGCKPVPPRTENNYHCPAAVSEYLVASKVVESPTEATHPSYNSNMRNAPFLCPKGLRCKACWKKYNKFKRQCFNDGYEAVMAQDWYDFLEEEVPEDFSFVKRRSRLKTIVDCDPVLKYDKINNRVAYVVTLLKLQFRIDSKGRKIG